MVKRNVFLATFKPVMVLAAALLLVFGASGCGKRQSATPSGALYELTILHTNDTHSNYGGFTEKGLINYSSYGEGGTGGSVRLDRALRSLRQKRDNLLYLDAGDQFQGTLFWTVHKERMPAEIMGLLGVDAFVPGNHEFDAGSETFFKFVRLLNVPVVAANLSIKDGVDGAEKISPWVIMEKGGRKIGVVGLLNPDTPFLSSPGLDVSFGDVPEALQKAVDEITLQGVDIVIALTHLGLETDKGLAEKVSGVDIIIGGHSHSLLSNENPAAEGPHPVVRKAPDGRPVLVATASSATQYLGVLDVVFDGDGVLQSWLGESLLLTDSNLEAMHAPRADKKLVQAVEKYARPIQEMISRPFAKIQVEGDPGVPLEENVRDCRFGECLTGDVVTDALLQESFNGQGEIVLLNGGALRVSLPGGDVTPGDILATLPFQNVVKMAEVKGSTILKALEHGVSAYGESKGSFLQTAGLRYAFSPSKQPGQRIEKAEVRLSGGQWQPLRKDATYKVLVPDFVAGGGDGFNMLSPHEWLESSMLMSDALRIYLEKNEVKPTLEGRIKILK